MIVAFWNDTVTFGNVITLAIGYSVGKAVSSYVIWRRLK